MNRAQVDRGTLEARLWSKIDVRGPDDCWPWKAGVSRSGRREVDYGCIREGRRGTPLWRANRLVLILKTAPTDVPRGNDEPFVEWLRRANRHYKFLEASHWCDVSMCCNPRHLDWMTHAENLKTQKLRERVA